LSERAARPGPRLLSGALLALVIGLATGCGSSVGAAKVATVTPTRAAEASDVERYVLGAGDLQVEAEVSAGKSATMVFPTRGTFAISASATESSQVDLDIDIASATSVWQTAADVGKARFLHTDRFPRSTFSTLSMKPTAGGVDVWVDFTLHGTKKTLVVPAVIGVDPCRARFSCEFSIDRGQFGVTDDGTLESIVSDEVIVRVAIDVPRKNAPSTCAIAKKE